MCACVRACVCAVVLTGWSTDPSCVVQVSRQSIDAVKEYFREDLQKSDWQLMVELKKQFHIL